MNKEKLFSEKSKDIGNSFLPSKEGGFFSPDKSVLHKFGNEHICITDTKGFATPKNQDPAKLIIHTSKGFIPLWAQNVNLRWRFNSSSLTYFQYPEEAKQEIRRLFSKAVLAWGDAAPVTFSEKEEAWDFEIVILPDNCNEIGCALASAFFPDSGRHKLVIHPKMFTQIEEEQVETLIHEIGHIFGLRHFFADINEKAYPSVSFGKHTPFTIMNYGADSKLTDDDKTDLKLLYQQVWKGELTKINGTKVVTFVSFHQVGRI